jgi:hypothetical protein
MKAPETKQIKIILITNMQEPWPAVKGKHEQFAKEIGAIGFVNKSEDLDIVIEKVKAAIKSEATANN